MKDQVGRNVWLEALREADRVVSSREAGRTRKNPTPRESRNDMLLRLNALWGRLLPLTEHPEGAVVDCELREAVERIATGLLEQLEGEHPCDWWDLRARVKAVFTTELCRSDSLATDEDQGADTMVRMAAISLCESLFAIVSAGGRFEDPPGVDTILGPLRGALVRWRQTLPWR